MKKALGKIIILAALAGLLVVGAALAQGPADTISTPSAVTTETSIQLNWETLIVGFVGILIQLMTKPQTERLDVVVTWIQNHAVSALVSGVLWAITWYAWCKGELTILHLGLAPTAMMAFMAGYFIKSLWSHMQDILFKGPLGLKV